MVYTHAIDKRDDRFPVAGDEVLLEDGGDGDYGQPKLAVIDDAKIIDGALYVTLRPGNRTYTALDKCLQDDLWGDLFHARPVE